MRLEDRELANLAYVAICDGYGLEQRLRFAHEVNDDGLDHDAPANRPAHHVAIRRACEVFVAVLDGVQAGFTEPTEALMYGRYCAVHDREPTQ